MAMAGARIPLLFRSYRLIKTFDLPALLVGSLTAAAGHRWGGYVLVVDVAVQVGAHLVLGTWAYRDVMTRPWPEVQRVDGGDWDE
jgi:hypothetical protein